MLCYGKRGFPPRASCFRPLYSRSRFDLRRLAAALTLAAILCGAASSLPVRAAPSSASPGSLAVPTATSFIYPVGNANIAPTWDPANGNGYFITQGFNNSCDPSLGQGYYLYGTYFCGHTGVDLASSSAGAVIHAAASGVVVVAGYYSGYGVMVRIRHLLPDGSVIYSQYEHMAYGSLSVYSGEVVDQGQELGMVGATGFATGAHLHFEIKSVDENGWGYTFGNDAMIRGYDEPLSFVAAHLAQPIYFIPGPGHASLGIPAESEYILRRFLQSYKHYVVVSASVGSEGLHLRSGPGILAPILGTTLRGAKLGYISTQGNWLQVALPQNVRGWVSRDYVTGYQDWSRVDALSKATFSKARTVWPPAGPVATVSVFGLNVRAAPGQAHQVISSVMQGDKVVLLTRTTNWARVLTHDGTRGWVLRRYLREPGQAAPAAPTYLIPAVPTLHVRNGPGLQYAVTGSVFQGIRMQVVRATPHWAAVILPGGTTGWVSRPLTVQARAGTPPRPATAPASVQSPRRPLVTAPRYLTVTATILNIRSAAGQSHPVIAQVRQGTSLQVLALTAHWAHVALPASRIDGWALLRFTR